jgi:hypothetical protein
MATYTISPGTDQDCFDVVIVGDDGARQTLLGFETRAAAEAWIIDDERRSSAEMQSSFRMQWRF